MKRIAQIVLLSFMLLGLAIMPAYAAGNPFSIETGLQGGAGVIGLGYALPTWDLNLRAGYALGNNYGVVIAKVSRDFILKDPFIVEVALDYASYSTAVANITGLSGTIPQGGKIGATVAFGKPLNDKMKAKLGYSTSLGLVASLEYKL